MSDLIDRQAAIDAFHKFSSDGDFVNACEYVLRNVPSAQSESCGDVISREYLKEHIEACWINGRPRYAPELNELLSWIDDVPSAQPELIEQAAYVRGFEQGRIQGKIDAQPDLQPTCNQLATDCISRQGVIDALDALCDRECEYSKKQRSVMCGACHLGSAFDVIEQLPPAQPELIERAAYVRGFEQGRIQGKIDAQQEIIKCEKCEHYTALTGICEVRGKGLRLIRRPDDFCSRGARREE